MTVKLMTLKNIIEETKEQNIIVYNVKTGYRFKIPNIKKFQDTQHFEPKYFGILGTGPNKNEFGGRYIEIYGWYKLNWVLEQAYTPNPGNRLVCYDHLGQKYASKIEMATAYGITKSTLQNRLKSGWKLKEALCYNHILSIGEQKVLNVLQGKEVYFFHNKTVKTIFTELGIKKEYNFFVELFQLELSKQGINYTKANISRMRPDFAIVKDETIHSFIEYDGEQHFKFVDLFFKTLEYFLKRCDADKVKTDFAELSGIPLLRIRYDQIDKIEIMLDDLLTNPTKYLTQHNTFLTEEEYWKPLKKESEKLGLEELSSSF